MKVFQKAANGVFHAAIITEVKSHWGEKVDVVRALCVHNNENKNFSSGDYSIRPECGRKYVRRANKLLEDLVIEGNVTCLNCLRKLQGTKKVPKLLAVKHKQSGLFVKDLCGGFTEFIEEALLYKKPENIRKSILTAHKWVRPSTGASYSLNEYVNLSWADRLQLKETCYLRDDLEIVELAVSVKGIVNTDCL